MTTVKELIEYLKTIPLDTELRVIEVYDFGHSTATRFVPMSLDEQNRNVEYTDLAGNKFVEKDSENWDRRFLDFGEE